MSSKNARERVKHAIDSANMFSAFADSTPVASNQDKMVVAGRFVTKKGWTLEKVIGIKECEGRHGNKSAECILNSLESYDTDTNYLYFQTYDFAFQCQGESKVHRRYCRTFLTNMYRIFRVSDTDQLPLISGVAIRRYADCLWQLPPLFLKDGHRSP